MSTFYFWKPLSNTCKFTLFFPHSLKCLIVSFSFYLAIFIVRYIYTKETYKHFIFHTKDGIDLGFTKGAKQAFFLFPGCLFGLIKKSKMCDKFRSDIPRGKLL